MPFASHFHSFSDIILADVDSCVDLLLAVFVLNGEGLIGARWNLNEDCSSLSSSVSGETFGMKLSADFVYEEASPKFRIHSSRQRSEGSSTR